MKKTNSPWQLRIYFEWWLECHVGALEVDTLLLLIYILVWGSSRDLYLNKQDKIDAYERKNKCIFWLGKGCDACLILWKASPQLFGKWSFLVIRYLHKSNNTLLLPPRNFVLRPVWVDREKETQTTSMDAYKQCVYQTQSLRRWRSSDVKNSSFLFSFTPFNVLYCMLAIWTFFHFRLFDRSLIWRQACLL